jgi:hypothetical protein
MARLLYNCYRSRSRTGPGGLEIKATAVSGQVMKAVSRSACLQPTDNAGARFDIRDGSPGKWVRTHFAPDRARPASRVNIQEPF